MAAIAIVTFDSGISQIERGSLLDCPAEFFLIGQMAFYAAAVPGWSRCPLGYSTYVAFDAMGRKLVVPGIIVPGQNAPNRKFPGHPIRFTQAQIESFLKPHLGISQQVREERDREFKNLTHDLRAISTEIYHSALTARSLAFDHNESECVRLIEAVLSAQQMMSLRLDIVDYESSPFVGRPKEGVPIFKKVDKVLHCFANKFNHLRLRVRTEGTSFSLAYGPPIFEIVPFVIVENAIKYSPYGTEIVIRFEETPSEIIVRFESFGPKIKDAEREKIFEQNFRGEAAKNSQKGGSGIGLYAAKTILESQFSGKIFVNQLDENIWYDNDVLYKTRFTIVVPIYQESSPVVPIRGRPHRAGLRQ